MSGVFDHFRVITVFERPLFGKGNVDAMRHHVVPNPPVPHDFYEGQGWVSQADKRAMSVITKARAVGRAKDKLSVLEYNALALWIKRRA
jgi:hypothetical protein